MKNIIGIAAAMALASALALGFVGIGLYHLDLARAEEALATDDFALARTIYARLEKRIERGSGIPWIIGKARADLQVRRSLVSYWQKDYAVILKETAAAEERGEALPPALRLIRANARYRGAAGVRSREEVLRSLGESIRDYAKIVEADPAVVDAAFNYELLLMLRSETASARWPALHHQKAALQSRPASGQGMHGSEGGEPKAKDAQKMKVIVPREGDEDPNKRGRDPSKGAATKKQG